MEHRAFPILLEFYREISGRYKYQKTAAELLCRDIGLRLEAEENLGILAGKLWPGDKSIELAPKAPVEHRAYVIYHELAHFQLGAKDHFFGRAQEPFRDLLEIDIKEEYWCDAFATAMLFAWIGHDVLSANPEAFWAAGTEAARGDLQYRDRSRDLYCGQRILLLNRHCFVHPHDDLTELGYDLCRLGEQRLQTAP